MKTKKSLITIDDIYAAGLEYDGSEGHFYRYNDKNNDDILVGWHDYKTEKRVIQIKRNKYFEEELVWLYETDKFPSGKFVHINGDMSNNKIDNLLLIEKNKGDERSVTVNSKNKTWTVVTRTLKISGKL